MLFYTYKFYAITALSLFCPCKINRFLICSILRYVADCIFL